MDSAFNLLGVDLWPMQLHVLSCPSVHLEPLNRGGPEAPTCAVKPVGACSGAMYSSYLQQAGPGMYPSSRVGWPGGLLWHLGSVSPPVGSFPGGAGRGQEPWNDGSVLASSMSPRMQGSDRFFMYSGVTCS